jgi:hypothetical protein
MQEIVESYNSYVAFESLIEENPDIKYNNFIDVTEQVKSGINIEKFKGLGLLFCVQTSELGINTNKIQFALNDIIQPGTKIWESKYRLVPDYNKTNGIGIEIDGIKYYELKKDAETAGKKYCVENKRDVYIVNTKVIKDANAVSQQIFYKPSLGQKMASFTFFD